MWARHDATYPCPSGPPLLDALARRMPEYGGRAALTCHGDALRERWPGVVRWRWAQVPAGVAATGLGGVQVANAVHSSLAGHQLHPREGAYTGGRRSVSTST